MRTSGLSSLLLVAFSMTAQADSLAVQRSPIVVFEGRSTILAAPYYTRLQTDPQTYPQTHPDTTMPDGIGVRPLEHQLPLVPTQLSPGQPDIKTVPGLVTPLFVMGMDAASLTWFSRAAEDLAAMGARGVVVQAAGRGDWQALQTRARAAGIDLMLLHGDSLALGYGIRSYPVVLVSPEQAEQGIHE